MTRFHLAGSEREVLLQFSCAGMARFFGSSPPPPPPRTCSLCDVLQIHIVFGGSRCGKEPSPRSRTWLHDCPVFKGPFLPIILMFVASCIFISK